MDRIFPRAVILYGKLPFMEDDGAKRIKLPFMKDDGVKRIRGPKKK